MTGYQIACHLALMWSPHALEQRDLELFAVGPEPFRARALEELKRRERKAREQKPATQGQE